METNRESGWGNVHWPMLTRISTMLLVFIFVGLRLIYGQEPPGNNNTPTGAVGFSRWRGLNLGRRESFHRRRLLVPLSGISSRVTTSRLFTGAGNRGK
jgi:hypothetical protein